MSMKLKDSLSMGDLEKINAASQRWDAESGQWKQDAFRGAIESVGVLVEEWTLIRRSSRLRQVFAVCRPSSACVYSAASTNTSSVWG